MLTLRKKICCHEIRIRIVVRENHNLGRTRHHVDVAITEYLSLGFGHIGIAGSHDLVDTRDRFSAERERSDGLRTPRFKNTVHF